MTVREEIVMLNRQAEAIRRTRIELEEELEQIEREAKSRCCCDGDYDYERGTYVATHSEICPEHDMCSDCGKHKAIEIMDGDKLCKECLEEERKGRLADEALVRSLRHTR